MRISEIAVSRLFGLFNHVVPMNLRDRVTIIHGPNGYGKTTLLRMLDSVASGRYSELRSIPFRDFQIRFDDGQVLNILRVDARGPQTREAAGPTLTITLAHGKTEQRTSLPSISAESLGFPLSYVERIIPHLERLGPTQWQDKKKGDVVNFEEIFRRYPNFLPMGEKLPKLVEPEWLVKFRETIPVRFIDSQRLLRIGKGRSHAEDEEPFRPAVVVYSRELAQLIKTKLTEYATLSQSLDRSFPKRLAQLAEAKGNERTSIDQLRTKLQLLEDKRASLSKAGLLDEENEDFDLASYLTNATLTQNVLPVYAEDVEQKLQVFDDIAPKIELLTSIVNAHFQFKEISISKDKGFQFATKYPGPQPRPRPLSPAVLSSGEQHMLVLLYELLFKVAPNSLIMIDEPEISLHVAWQLEFLSDIQRITEITGIDVLLATHAPGIINERLDLAVALQAPAEAT